MSRTPLLTALLWTTLGAAALGACGEDPVVIIDAALPDGSADAYVGPLAQFPSALALSAECGVALPPTVDLVVSNVGTTTLTISGATASGGFAVTTAFPVDVPAGGSAPLAVRPPVATIGTDLGGATRTGVLSLNTNQPGTIGTVALTSTIHGANLRFEDGASQPLAQVLLSSSTGACPAPATVVIRNTGNLEAVLGAASASGGIVTLGALSSSTVAPGATASHTVTPQTFGACSGADTIQYQVTGTVCTTLPIALQATLDITGASSCFCS